MDKGLRIGLFAAAVGIAALGVMLGGWRSPIVATLLLVLALVLAALAIWPHLNHLVLRSPFVLHTEHTDSRAPEMLDPNVPYSPIYVSRAEIDLAKLIPQLATIEHDHVLWRLTMPSMADSVADEISGPSPEVISVRPIPFCPKCENELSTRAGTKAGEWQQYCLNCGWKQVTSTEPARQRDEAMIKARGRYRALMKFRGPRGDRAF